MADNASIYKNTSTGLITVKTSRGANEVEQVLSGDMEEYKVADAALALAGAIPNPLGAVREALEEEKQRRYKDREEANRVLQKEKMERAEEREQAQKALQEVQEKLAQANNRLATLLTGDPGAQATKEMIELYPEWAEGLSVDSGDAYRIGDTLYMAIRAHVTSKENGPESEKAKDYWKGGVIKQDQPDPKPGVKYPKGTVVAYQGVDYYATVDTNEGPEVGYPTWDLLSNKPQD